MEPAAILVAAFQVKIGGPAQLGPRFRDRRMAEPESNQTSMVSVSCENPAAAAGQEACGQDLPRLRLNQAEPSLAKGCAPLRWFAR